MGNNLWATSLGPIGQRSIGIGELGMGCIRVGGGMGPLSLQWGVPGAASLGARTSPCAQTFAPGFPQALLRNLHLKFCQCLWGVIGGLDWECVELWTFHQVCKTMSFPCEEPTPCPQREKKPWTGTWDSWGLMLACHLGQLSLSFVNSWQ